MFSEISLVAVLVEMEKQPRLLSVKNSCYPSSVIFINDCLSDVCHLSVISSEKTDWSLVQIHNPRTNRRVACLACSFSQQALIKCLADACHSSRYWGCEDDESTVPDLRYLWFVDGENRHLKDNLNIILRIVGKCHGYRGRALSPTWAGS